MSRLALGKIVPVTLQVKDGNVSLFPQATVRDNEENILTTIDLVHNVAGEYIPPADYLMPNEQFIKIQYIAYTDSGHTTESSYDRDIDVFTLSADASSGGSQFKDFVEIQVDGKMPELSIQSIESVEIKTEHSEVCLCAVE